MTTTRKYYEKLLDILEELVTIRNNDFSELTKIRIELNNIIRKIKIYKIFELNLSEEFNKWIENNNASEFGKIQSSLSLELYTLLGELLYSLETTDRETDYGRALEIYRTELPFSVIKNWKIKGNENHEFRMDMLFFDLNRKWIEIDSEEKYLEYKEQIRNQKTPIRRFKKLVKIPNEKYLILKSHFGNLFSNYQNYIFDNYPTICHEFYLYDSVVKIYIVEQKGKQWKYTKYVNVYKSVDGQTSITISPHFYDFISLFSNLEEIDAIPISSSYGMFEIDNPNKFNFHFSIASIHHDLLQIFIRNSDEINIRNFLIFLLRSELKDVQEIDKIQDELIINRKEYCKLFLLEVPVLKEIKQSLQLRSNGKKYSFVAFKSRPDDETLSLLKTLKIQPIFVLSLANDHINNQNGEIIEWYIKSKLNNLEIKKNNQNENQAEQLLQRLENCPFGMKGWFDYENICTDIFEYLFRNDFRNYTFKIQSYTYDHIFRRDLIVNNNFCDSTSVWGQAKNDFSCNVIVVDFKNYENPLEQNEFYLPSKYLNLVTGNFGIIISRRGLSNSSKLLQKRLLNTSNQLLLSLEDKDLIGMLRDKSLNQDPSYRLENLKFSLYEEL